MDGRPSPPDLTGAILARTSGSPCARLREQACAYVDGGLDGIQRTLVDTHLAHCPGCAGLVAALCEARTVLPSLSTVDPGPWFTSQVLRATVKAPIPAGFWLRLMHRPRVALETAFLGTAAGLVGMALPLPVAGRAADVPALVQPLETTLRAAVVRVSGAEQRLAVRTVRTLQSQARRPKDAGARLAARMRRWFRPDRPSRSSEPANP